MESESNPGLSRSHLGKPTRKDLIFQPHGKSWPFSKSRAPERNIDQPPIFLRIELPTYGPDSFGDSRRNLTPNKRIAPPSPGFVLFLALLRIPGFPFSFSPARWRDSLSLLEDRRSDCSSWGAINPVLGCRNIQETPTKNCRNIDQPPFRFSGPLLVEAFHQELYKPVRLPWRAVSCLTRTVQILWLGAERGGGGGMVDSGG